MDVSHCWMLDHGTSGIPQRWQTSQIVPEDIVVPSLCFIKFIQNIRVLLFNAKSMPDISIRHKLVLIIEVETEAFRSTLAGALYSSKEL